MDVKYSRKNQVVSWILIVVHKKIQSFIYILNEDGSLSIGTITTAYFDK